MSNTMSSSDTKKREFDKNSKTYKKLVEKYSDKFPIFSYSKCSTLDSCPYEYYLARIKGVPTVTNIYSVLGEHVHNILESLYRNEIEFSKMNELFYDRFLETELKGFVFTKDKDRNKLMSSNYEKNLKDFFLTHNKIKERVFCEKEVWVDLDGDVFVGYIDCLIKDGDKFTILDYKTSSINGYKGEEQGKKAMQLLLYAYALIQAGIKKENIKVGWNMLKYTKISHKEYTKKGVEKIKEKIVERRNKIKDISSWIEKDLKEFYPDLTEWDYEMIVCDCIDNHNISSLDERIKERFTFEDCIIYVDVNDENINNMINYLKKKVLQIKRRTEENDWGRDPITSDEFFKCANLCSVKNDCEYYKNYIKR